jgi:hypothetical protein
VDQITDFLETSIDTQHNSTKKLPHKLQSVQQSAISDFDALTQLLPHNNPTLSKTEQKELMLHRTRSNETNVYALGIR